MIHRWLLLGLYASLSACSNTIEPSPPMWPPCDHDDQVVIRIDSIPVTQPAIDNLTIFGDLQLPPTATALGVTVGAMATADGGAPPSVSAVTTSPQFATWKAIVPLEVLLAPTEMRPATIYLTAFPVLNCATAASAPPQKITVDVPPDAGVDAAVDAGVDTTEAIQR